MSNIESTYDDEPLEFVDPEINMRDLGRWSPLIARKLAREEGIEELTEPHWHVIYALRDFHREGREFASARIVLHLLEQDFVAEGGRRFLYELFPKGPVSQGSRLAGVPAPPYSSDPSFGWAG